MKHYHPTLTVYTGPDWLYNMFNGVRNQKGTAEIRPITDPDGRRIIGKQVLDDPDFDFMEGTHLPDPENPEDVRLIRDWLEEIPYCYDDDPLAE